MNFLPTVVNIETVNRYCDARCPMCTIKFVPENDQVTVDENSYKGVSRKAEIMTLDNFEKVARRFVPYIDKITALNLHGCGEPLLDKSLAKKISLARDIGFSNIGFSSNCNLLSQKKTEELLRAGLNCLIASIDGFSKDVQEEIRPRTNFEQIYENVTKFIEHRDAANYPCRVLPRMVRQQLNKEQWESYERYWNELISPEKGDKVLFMDIHNTGGKVPDFSSKKVAGYDEQVARFINGRNEKRITFSKSVGSQGSEWQFIRVDNAEKSMMCPDLFARINIFASGDVALCSADQAGYYKIGNLVDEELETIYNGEVFTDYREKWLSGAHNKAKYCDTCTIAVSRFNKSYTSV